MIIANQKERGVLIIDDDPGVRHSLSARLKQDGFTTVFCAEDGLRALTCLELEGERIYVIVTDVVMPAMDGMKLVEHLTANYHHPTGIIYMSGFQERMRDFKIGDFSSNEIMSFDFFSKPFSYVELITRIIQCGDLVFNRRISLSRYSIEHLSGRLDTLQAVVEDIPKKLDKVFEMLAARHPSLLEELGFELVKALAIAAFVLVSLKAIDISKLFETIT